MSWSIESRTGAAAPVAGSAAPVRLRLSALDRLWVLVRWMLWTAGLTVVLWLGAAFLSSAPASAAVPAVAIASQGLLKAGPARTAGGSGDYSGDDEGSWDDSGDGGNSWDDGSDDGSGDDGGSWDDGGSGDDQDSGESAAKSKPAAT